MLNIFCIFYVVIPQNLNIAYQIFYHRNTWDLLRITHPSCHESFQHFNLPGKSQTRCFYSQSFRSRTDQHETEVLLYSDEYDLKKTHHFICLIQTYMSLLLTQNSNCTTFGNSMANIWVFQVSHIAWRRLYQSLFYWLWLTRIMRQF